MACILYLLGFLTPFNSLPHFPTLPHPHSLPHFSPTHFLCSSLGLNMVSCQCPCISIVSLSTISAEVAEHEIDDDLCWNRQDHAMVYSMEITVVGGVLSKQWSMQVYRMWWYANSGMHTIQILVVIYGFYKNFKNVVCLPWFL